MVDAIANALSGVGSAIAGAFSWSLAKLGLNNRPAMKDNAIAARDEATKQQVEKDFQQTDPAKLESDLDPGA
jgi:hypothetical protein